MSASYQKNKSQPRKENKEKPTLNKRRILTSSGSVLFQRRGY